MIPSHISKVCIGDAVLFHADCMDVLPMLDEVDCIVTDPPYGISQDDGLTTKWHKHYGRIDFGGWDSKFPYEVLKLFADSKAQTYYIFAPYQALGKLSEWSKNNGLQERVLWWLKTNPTRRNCQAYWAIPGEHIFYAKRPGANFTAEYKVGCFVHPTLNKEGMHPTQKPVDLIKAFIEASTDKKDVVADFYMGSGTTGVAALKLGRKFVGVEIESKYFDMAVERIKREHDQGKLF